MQAASAASLQCLMPPQGDEHAANSPGNLMKSAIGGNAGCNIQRELKQLVAVWHTLPQLVRSQCLELAGIQTQALVDGDS